jgi:hypothetical protein
MIDGVVIYTFVRDCWRARVKKSCFFRNISPFVSFLNKEKVLVLGPSLFLFIWDPKRTKYG